MLVLNVDATVNVDVSVNDGVSVNVKVFGWCRVPKKKTKTRTR